MGNIQESVSGSCLCLYNHRQVRQGWWVAQDSQGEPHGGRWAESPRRGGAVEGPAADAPRAGGLCLGTVRAQRRPHTPPSEEGE